MANNNIDVCHCPHLQNISPAPVSWSPPASGRTVCDRTLGWGRADGRVPASSLAQESPLGPRHNTSNTTHLSSFYISEFHKSEAEWFTKKIQTTKIRYYCTNSVRIRTFTFCFVRRRKTHTLMNSKYPRLLHPYTLTLSRFLRLISSGTSEKV